VGVLQVMVGFFATLGMFTFYGLLLPVVAMAIALYLVRAWPLNGLPRRRS
jgi:predicted PurR-regulated permease PerM